MQYRALGWNPGARLGPRSPTGPKEGAYKPFLERLRDQQLPVCPAQRWALASVKVEEGMGAAPLPGQVTMGIPHSKRDCITEQYETGPHTGGMLSAWQQGPFAHTHPPQQGAAQCQWGAGTGAGSMMQGEEQGLKGTGAEVAGTGRSGKGEEGAQGLVALGCNAPCRRATGRTLDLLRAVREHKLHLPILRKPVV